MNVFKSIFAQVPSPTQMPEGEVGGTADLVNIDNAANVESGANAAETASAASPLSWESFLDTLMKSFQDILNNIISEIPTVAIALIVLIVGFIVAAIVKKVIGGVLKGIKFDEVLDKVGIGEIFRKIGVKDGVSKLLTKLIFWILLLFIFKTAAGLMGVQDITDIVDKIIAFLPKVLIASIIMLVGFMVADMVRTIVFNALDNLGLDYAKGLAGIIFGFIFIIVLTVALSQLEIQTELLNASVKIILASLGLGLAICLGLGLKKMASQIVAGVYARDLFQVGTTIEYDGEETKVAGVGPVTTKLMTKDGGFIMVPNDELISTSTKGHSAE